MPSRAVYTQSTGYVAASSSMYSSTKASARLISPFALAAAISSFIEESRLSYSIFASVSSAGCARFESVSRQAVYRSDGPCGCFSISASIRRRA